jgi:hypothetical protein
MHYIAYSLLLTTRHKGWKDMEDRRILYYKFMMVRYKYVLTVSNYEPYNKEILETAFLTPALNGDERTASHPSHITPSYWTGCSDPITSASAGN